MNPLKSKAVLALVGEYLDGIELKPWRFIKDKPEKMNELREQARLIASLEMFHAVIDFQIKQYQDLIFKATDTEMNAARILALKDFRDQLQNLAKPI